MPFNPAHIERTSLNQLTTQDITWIHLHANPLVPCKEHLILSTLGLALSEARSAIAREQTSIFLPLLGAFAALDQIGTTYADAGKLAGETANWSGIKKALHHFSNIDGNSNECKALYALRNALVHNGSIASRGRIEQGKPKGPFHRFAFSEDIPVVVQLPPVPWDGQWGQAPYTKINRQRLLDLLDEVIKKVRALFHDQRLQSRISADELFDSFILFRPK